MDDEDYFGLSSGNINYIVALIFFALLTFGPVEPYGLVVRVLYLIAVPLVLWFALRFFGRLLNLEPRDNDHISRAITASISGMLIVAAYQRYTAKYHAVCTQSVRDGQGGSECVGDFVTALGPDKGTGFALVVFAGLAFWLAIARRPS